MSVDGTQPGASFFDPANESGDVLVTLTLTMRELVALSLTVSYMQNTDGEDMLVKSAEEHGVGRGYFLAWASVAVKTAAALSKATGYAEGREGAARVTAKIDQKLAEWREAA